MDCAVIGGNTLFAHLFSVPCGPDVVRMRRSDCAAFFFNSLKGDPRYEALLDEPKNVGPLFRVSMASRWRCPARGFSSGCGIGQRRPKLHSTGMWASHGPMDAEEGVLEPRLELWH